jgi:hypothetical protein
MANTYTESAQKQGKLVVGAIVGVTMGCTYKFALGFMSFITVEVLFSILIELIRMQGRIK